MADTDAQQPARTIAVVDGNSLMHRAFHAISTQMTAPDGRPTNAIFGFISMFLKMVETFHPDGVAVAFDHGKPQIRIDMLPQYKAQRPPMDPALHEQFPMIKELLGAMDVPVLELTGWEGDDILGTIARKGEAEGFEMLLVTGDRDMYQLATDHVKIVSTRKGLSDVSIMTPESVNDLYHGITPELVPDFYGLKGDSSDNIPGVPGIGPKRAAELIERYGNLEGVIAHADEVPGKMGENLREHVDDALLSRKVATIMCDAPIEVNLDEMRFPTFDPTAVSAAFHALGFTSLTKRVLALEGAPTPAASVSSAAELPDVREGAAAEEALEDICSHKAWVGVALDEDKDADALFGLAHTLWVAAEDALLRFEGDAADAALARLFREGRIVAGDIKALAHVVFPADSSQSTAIEADDICTGRIFDCAVADYLLESDRSSYELAELAAELLEQPLPAPSEAYPQAALDAHAARLLRPVLEQRLRSDESQDLFYDLELPLIAVLCEMERTGLHADPAILHEQSAELGAEIDAMVATIKAEVGEDFNLDSPQQLSHVLFDVLGLPTGGLKKTKRGFYSTNAKVLDELAQSYPIVAEVLEYRERAKIKSTYLDALPALIAGDGRIHTTFNQTVAATGRLSSSDPNLQNIPTRSELGHRVRQAFTVPEGSVFLACDYSQIELRLLAHLSGDEHLIAAFQSGADFHAATASRVFDVPAEEVTPEMRSRAKAVNFGIVYGQQAFGLASSLKIPRAEAQGMIDRYFEVYPGVRRFLDEQVAFAHKHGWVRTMYGRKRHIRELASHNRQLVAFGERTAMNHPMQGSAADIIKIAMVRVTKALEKEHLQSKLVLQIHDELDFEVPTEELDELSALVKETMEGVAELKVPLVADVSWGTDWARAK